MFNENIQSAILKLHRAVFPFPRGWFAAAGPAAGNLIHDRLLSGSPLLITRLGSIEAESMMAYLYQDQQMSRWERLYRFASWDIRYRGWQKPLKDKLSNNAGFFPAEKNMLDRFAGLYLSLIPQIDILGSWLHAEIALQDRMPAAHHIPLRDLEPYLSPNPWSRALRGKRVLVIHPFTESIQSQYTKRRFLFKNPDILPEFELRTLRAVQSSGGERPPFSDWFQALESMKEQVSQTQFDIALIGAGAYGLPLAAHVKSIGKQAVHLGGATQLLFGIYGQRWADDPKIKALLNEYWVRPLPSERVGRANSIENGCYW